MSNPQQSEQDTDLGSVMDAAASTWTRPSTKAIKKAIDAVALSLDMRIDRRPLIQSQPSDSADILGTLSRAAEDAGIYLRETEFRSAAEAMAMVSQGYSVLFLRRDGSLIVLERNNGAKIDVSIIDDQLRHETLSEGRLAKFVGTKSDSRMIVAKKELECETLSGSLDPHRSHQDNGHPTPIQRFIALLDLDRRDIVLVVLFAGVSGVLALATPLVIESLVNVVSWGVYFQPLLVLAGMLLVCLGIAGVLRVLQTWVVEIIQRRQFVRIVSDLAHRFPRANQAALDGSFPRELANRVFDIMTIQKATAILLLDGISIVLTTILGMTLLAFYHPFLLGFDIVLLLTMLLFTWLLGRGGITTAIAESKTKYAVAHWLQDVISMPSAFKSGGGESLAVMRANQLTAEYVRARKRQFGVIIRQSIFAVGLQVVASTALLGLGGWLVIDRQLTLGQLVASELVVTVVLGAFAKAGKSLEKFYDLMAGIDKVGHLLDISPDPRNDIGDLPEGALPITWTDLHVKRLTHDSRIDAGAISPGTMTAVLGEDQTAKHYFAKSIAGLVEPDQGMIQIGEFDSHEAGIASPGKLVGYAGPPETFHGSIADNVSLGRERVNPNRVRNVLKDVNLSQVVLSLPDGLNTRLQSNGHPLEHEQCCQLMIARAMATSPNVLVIDGLMDQLGLSSTEVIWSHLRSISSQCTVVIVTNRDDIAGKCENKIYFR